MSELLLNMTGIKKSFGGVHALSDGQLKIHKGEVHGFVGENGAGKSTMCNILLGIHKQDAGTIEFKGRKVDYMNPNEALKDGIAMIHQEVSLVPQTSVADNIWLGQEKQFMRGPVVMPGAVNKRTQELLDSLKIDVSATAIVADLSIAQMQLVEIARAVSRDADLILMDEPTSALTDKEVDVLHDIVKLLVSEGKTIVFISHKLPELFRFCDNITIMRDGQFIECCDAKTLSYDRLLKLIVGRENVEVYKHESCYKDEVALEVKGLSENGVYKNVSFKVRKGEIVGFSGLMGAGRTEIMSAVFGTRKPDKGEIFVYGKKVAINSPQTALKYGIGMVTEDRLRLGSIASMSVEYNATISDLKQFVVTGGVLNLRKEDEKFEEVSKFLQLKYGDAKDPIGSLSGGNQQKVIFMRWLIRNCSILILDEPTRGVDVGAKNEIYKLIDNLAKQGMAIVLISSEMPEILALCDRIHVVREGQIVFECEGKEATQELLIKHAFGV